MCYNPHNVRTDITEVICIKLKLHIIATKFNQPELAANVVARVTQVVASKTQMNKLRKWILTQFT